MLFNSLSYILFLTVSVLAYWLTPGRHRHWLVLAASIFFYASWRVEFVFLVCFSAFVDYWFSLKIADTRHPDRRKIYLLSSIGTNIGLLLYFKYTYFLANNIASIGDIFGLRWDFSLWKIILPLGISFYTFLSISYTIDVYRRLFDPIRNFGVYLAYVLFWPHMIAGPILRAHELIPQIVRSRLFHSEFIAGGVRKILFGLFLKVALADQLAPLVDDAFSINPSKLGGVDVLSMSFAFGLQIYFDFAGYSLIAIGSAALMGIHFPENFNWPYLSTTPREFWRRWHITLSSWIRDYLYLPLAGRRFQDISEGGLTIQDSNNDSSARRLTIALFLSWFIMGLWHGANWKFAFWGVWHACLIMAHRLSKGRFLFVSGVGREVLGWCVTIPVVMLGWIPFRAASLSSSVELLSRLFHPHGFFSLGFRENFYLAVFVITACMLLVKAALSAIEKAPLPAYARQIGDIAVLAFIISADFIFLRPVSQFIYFQF